jgi:hypothetical protein
MPITPAARSRRTESTTPAVSPRATTRTRAGASATRQQGWAPQTPTQAVGPASGTRAASKLSAAELKRAADFVKQNAGGDYEVARGKLFPGLTSGNDGLVTHALSGAEAKRAVELAAAWSGGRAPSFDPAKQMVVVVRTTDDEARTFVNIVDRATGKGALVGYDMNFVDVQSELDAASLKRFFPKAQELWGPDDFNKSLVKSGTALGI